MNKLNTRRLQILEEVSKFYNINNLCMGGDGRSYGNCAYWTPEKPHGCAVGRLLSLEERRKLSEQLDQSGEDTGVITAFKLLPSHIQELGKIFLINLQALHDSKEHWDKYGLSRQGKADYERIELRIKDGFYDKY